MSIWNPMTDTPRDEEVQLKLATGGTPFVGIGKWVEKPEIPYSGWWAENHGPVEPLGWLPLPDARAA